MPKQIARWNSARDVWETRMTGLFCEHSDVFLETWPTSGTTRDGTAYALPTWVRPTGAFASSCLLPSPTVSEANGPGLHGDGGQDLRTLVSLLPTPTVQDASNTAGPSQMDRNSLPLNTVVTLLPTPRATDGTKGGPNQRGSSGDLMLPSAVTHLLPTPACNDMGEGKTVDAWDAWTERMQAKHGNGNGHGKSLAIEAQRLLPTPQAGDAKGARFNTGGNPMLGESVKSIGASMPPPSSDGNESSDEQHLPLPRQAPKADNA